MPTTSSRIKVCVEAGSVEALFPLLSTWTLPELNALVADLEEFYDLKAAELNSVWKEVAFRPEVFLSKDVSAGVDKVRDDATVDLFAMCTEISSVAQLYIYEKNRRKDG